MFASAPLGLSHVSGAVPPQPLACPPPPSAGGGGLRWRAWLGLQARGRRGPAAAGATADACRRSFISLPPRPPPGQPPPRQPRPRGRSGCGFVPAPERARFPARHGWRDRVKPHRDPGVHGVRPCAVAPADGRLARTRPSPAAARVGSGTAGRGGVWRSGSPAAHGVGGIRPLHPGECGSGWGSGRARLGGLVDCLERTRRPVGTTAAQWAAPRVRLPRAGEGPPRGVGGERVFLFFFFPDARRSRVLHSLCWSRCSRPAVATPHRGNVECAGRRGARRALFVLSARGAAGLVNCSEQRWSLLLASAWRPPPTGPRVGAQPSARVRDPLVAHGRSAAGVTAALPREASSRGRAP